MNEIKPEDEYLTRAWLEKHGWKPFRDDMPFHGELECDLVVIVTRKEYMIAKFHHMGDKAWEPSAKPDSFELVGLNNSVEMLDYDHTRLVMAAFVCHLTGFEQIDNAIGGVYEMTMQKRPEPLKLKAKAKKTFTINGVCFKRGLKYPIDNYKIWADIHETPVVCRLDIPKFSVGYKHRKVSVKGHVGIVDFYDERTANDNPLNKKPCFDEYFEELEWPNQ